MGVSVITEHTWERPPSGEWRGLPAGPVTYRIWHANPACRRFRKADVVARDVPVTSGNAGLPCSYCALEAGQVAEESG